MAQRNITNERYTDSTKRSNVTRKSAASMKPKAQAAASVRMESKKKTDQQKKESSKEAKRKDRELNAKYYDPPTARYKKLRTIWWVLLGVAVLGTVASIFARQFMPEWLMYVVLVLTYGCIVGALYVDLGLMRKERKKYRLEQEGKSTKEKRAAEKAEKAAQRAEKAASKKAAAPAKEKSKKPIPTVGQISSTGKKKK